jgi:hypothetical protein
MVWKQCPRSRKDIIISAGCSFPDHPSIGSGGLSADNLRKDKDIPDALVQGFSLGGNGNQRLLSLLITMQPAQMGWKFLEVIFL